MVIVVCDVHTCGVIGAQSTMLFPDDPEHRIM
jgi:hypothetical protein